MPNPLPAASAALLPPDVFPDRLRLLRPDGTLAGLLRLDTVEGEEDEDVPYYNLATVEDGYVQTYCDASSLWEPDALAAYAAERGLRVETPAPDAPPLPGERTLRARLTLGLGLAALIDGDPKSPYAAGPARQDAEDAIKALALPD